MTHEPVEFNDVLFIMLALTMVGTSPVRKIRSYRERRS
jgi:hypothetical protein